MSNLFLRVCLCTKEKSVLMSPALQEKVSRGLKAITVPHPARVALVKKLTDVSRYSFLKKSRGSAENGLTFIEKVFHEVITAFGHEGFRMKLYPEKRIAFMLYGHNFTAGVPC